MTISLQTLQLHRSPAIITPVIPGRQGFVCPAQRMLEAGDDDAAEAYVHRLRRHFAQQRCEAFRPLAGRGPWVSTSFCAVCEAIRRDCRPDGFLSLPWAVDARNRAMPISGRGPLAPTRSYPRTSPLPANWREQVVALAECVAGEQFAETRRAVSSPVGFLTRNILNRSGRQLAEGVLLLAFLQAGFSFDTANDGRTVRITIGGSDSLRAADAICRRLIGGAAAANHPPLLVASEVSPFDSSADVTPSLGDPRAGDAKPNNLRRQSTASNEAGRSLFPSTAAASIPPLAVPAIAGGER